MINAAGHLPAWVLTCLPVALARKLVQVKRIQPEKNTTATFEVKNQLLVDVSVVYQNDARTGIQRVVRALLLQLLASPPQGYTVCPIFATRKQEYCYAQPNFLDGPKKALNSTELDKPAPVHVKNGDLFLALDLAAHLLPHHQSQILHWKRRGVRMHVVIYDLLPLQHPEWFNPKTTRNFKEWINWVARYADHTVCISNTVQKELHIWLGKIYHDFRKTVSSSVIVLGADMAATAPSRGIPVEAKLLLTRIKNAQSVLMVGTLEPRKGYKAALDAFEVLWKNSTKKPILIIAGKKGWKTEELQEKINNHPRNREHLFWIDSASDEFLGLLYSNCSGVLVASHAEGFGLPLIEAELYCKPVLARNLPVFQEISGMSTTFFNESSTDDFSKSIAQWLDTLANPKEQTLNGNKNVYTWKESASQLITNILTH